MSKQENNEFKFPCVYSIKMNGEIKFTYSNLNNKVCSEFLKSFFQKAYNTGSHIDEEGKYAMNQWCFAIVDDVEFLEKIQKAITSKSFLSDLCHNL